mmetsp:Transcript_6419/g.11169  ORF Transcript_6419/g.11169 Transcript_6419/m.11169 type:complete len:97 (-) Transcript_6419:8-298(-)
MGRDDGDGKSMLWLLRIGAVTRENLMRKYNDCTNWPSGDGVPTAESYTKLSAGAPTGSCFGCSSFWQMPIMMYPINHTIEVDLTTIAQAKNGMNMC